MAKLHYFNFSWGYVESARIASLPSWYHREGFETVEEAATSFAQCLMTQGSPVRTCPEHGTKRGKFCNICGAELKISHPTWRFAYEYFDRMYQMDNDEAPSSDTEQWDENWLAEWEINAQGLKPTVVERFDEYLDSHGDSEFLIHE